MEVPASDLDLYKKVVSLERTGRILSGLMFLSLVVCLYQGWQLKSKMTSQGIMPRRIEAEELVIVDKEHKVLARLGHDSYKQRGITGEGFGLFLYTYDEKSLTALLSQGHTGSELLIRDELSQECRVGTDGDGMSYVKVGNQNSESSLTVFKDLTPEGNERLSSLRMGHAKQFAEFVLTEKGLDSSLGRDSKTIFENHKSF